MVTFNQPARERVGLFVDGTNMYYLQRALQMNIDYVKLRNHFETRQSRVAYSGYYTAIEERPDGSRPLQPLVDALSANGWTMCTKMTRAYRQPNGSVKLSGNVDVDLALDVLEMSQFLDRVILMTGDGDFAGLVHRVKKRAVNVTVVSSVRARMFSEELRRAATDVVDLADIQDEVCTPMVGV